jgi:DNA-binding SARP family transcriptional activator
LPVHLAEREWTRLALLGLARSTPPDASPGAPRYPLTMELTFDEIAVTVDSRIALEPPFVSTPPLGPPGCAGHSHWSLRREWCEDSWLSLAPAGMGAALACCLVAVEERAYLRRMVSPTAAGVIALEGEDDAVANLARSMAVEAATQEWSEGGEVIAVGLGADLHGLCRLHAVPTPSAALAEIARIEARGGRAPATVFIGGETLAELAARRGGAGHPPRDCTELAALDMLLARASADPPRAGVIASGPVPGARCIVRAPGRDVRSSSIIWGAGECTAVPAGERFARRNAIVRLSPVGAVPAPGVTVSVLGPVEIAGTAMPLARRPKLTELVTYLAMHPEGSSTGSWSTALWPDRRMPPSTLANRLSETRKCLGRAGDGAARVRKRGDRYFVDADVTTDWEHFRELSGPGTTPSDWRSALELVRGRPFEGLRHGHWTVLDGFTAEIESAVVDVACRLAAHLLGEGDADGATWAGRRGMLVSQWDERLWRFVMLAADTAGNRAGVEAVLREMAQVFEIEDDPLRGVHPETAELYRRLTRDCSR